MQHLCTLFEAVLVRWKLTVIQSFLYLHIVYIGNLLGRYS